MQIQKPWRIQVGPQPAMGSHILVRWLKRGHLHVLHEMIMSKNSVYTFNAWKKDFRCRNDSSKEWFLSFSKYYFPFLKWQLLLSLNRSTIKRLRKANYKSEACQVTCSKSIESQFPPYLHWLDLEMSANSFRVLPATRRSKLFKIHLQIIKCSDKSSWWPSSFFCG